ncbi:MAG: hypothetical protein DCC71_04575 [Proteobacteria bacterium]|nr:MAG: hypothetical protein DCC71_04575 [Pseudomonadota bacterium]
MTRPRRLCYPHSTSHATDRPSGVLRSAANASSKASAHAAGPRDLGGAPAAPPGAAGAGRGGRTTARRSAWRRRSLRARPRPAPPQKARPRRPHSCSHPFPFPSAR